MSNKLFCTSEDLKFPDQSLIVYIGSSKSGKSTTLANILLNQLSFFTFKPSKIVYLRKFPEPHHKNLKKQLKNQIKFIDWNTQGRKFGPTIAELLQKELNEPNSVVICDDCQTDLELSFENVLLASAIPHHTRSTIIISMIIQKLLCFLT